MRRKGGKEGCEGPTGRAQRRSGDKGGVKGEEIKNCIWSFCSQAASICHGLTHKHTHRPRSHQTVVSSGSRQRGPKTPETVSMATGLLASSSDLPKRQRGQIPSQCTQLVVIFLQQTGQTWPLQVLCLQPGFGVWIRPGGSGGAA